MGRYQSLLHVREMDIAALVAPHLGLQQALYLPKFRFLKGSLIVRL